MTNVSILWLNGDETQFDKCRTIGDVKALASARINQYFSSVLTFDTDSSEIITDDTMSPPQQVRVIIFPDEMDDDTAEDERNLVGCRWHSSDTWVRRLVVHAAARDETIWGRSYEQMTAEGREDWHSLLSTALLSYVSSQTWQIETIMSFLRAGTDCEEFPLSPRKGQKSGRDSKSNFDDYGAVVYPPSTPVDESLPVIFSVARKCFCAMNTMGKFYCSTTRRFNNIPFDMYDDTMVVFGTAIVSMLKPS